MAQVGQILGPDRRPGLDRDGYHPSVGAFQNGVHPSSVFGAVVAQPPEVAATLD